MTGIEKLTNEQRRALRVLARHSTGCLQAVLLADGFSVSQLVILVIDGFATMRRMLAADISGRDRKVIWLQITETGRKAIAG
jgi:hypothetical protein